jgi:vacuolar-type H+-ATPase subunit E/Vma4
LDALQKEILDEARKKSTAIEKGAMEEAEAVIREAKAKANAANEAFERELKDEMSRMSFEYKSSREMQERNILLAARERLIDDLVERARATVVKRIREKGYKRLFDSAIAEARKISPMEDLTLVIDKDDARYAKGFTGKIKYAKSDGLVVYAAGGRIRIDATLDTLFDRNRAAVREALMSGIFGTRMSAGARKAAGAKSRPAKRKAKRKPAKKASKKAGRAPKRGRKHK